MTCWIFKQSEQEQSPDQLGQTVIIQELKVIDIQRHPATLIARDLDLYQVPV